MRIPGNTEEQSNKLHPVSSWEKEKSFKFVQSPNKSQKKFKKTYDCNPQYQSYIREINQKTQISQLCPTSVVPESSGKPGCATRQTVPLCWFNPRNGRYVLVRCWLRYQPRPAAPPPAARRHIGGREERLHSAVGTTCLTIRPGGGEYGR